MKQTRWMSEFSSLSERLPDFSLVDTSNEGCENGEHIQDVDSFYHLAVALKISRGQYV